MQTPSFDPGLTQKYNGPINRAINKDGTFNVERRGTDWRDVNPYLRLVSMSWPRFFGFILLGYTLANLIFATVYFMLGPHALQGGMEPSGNLERILTDFFFSSQTLTTVGFGAIAPKSHEANLVAAFEAMIGLLGFAVATGVLLGRVSKPSARIGFSERAIMSPYQDGLAFQFRLVNRRRNSLMELEATLMLMTVSQTPKGYQRDFKILKLERDSVLFFPLTWTIVHPVDAESPLSGKSADDLKQAQAEFMILIKGWDETFGQTVHQRFSYRFDEIVWNARFEPAFEVGTSGDMVLEVGKVGALTPVDEKKATA